MKIFIVGYGKMGKTIECIAKDAGHEIVAIVDDGQFWPRFNEDDKPDVAIEFSQPSSAFENIKQCVEWGIPIISGTTGWEGQKEEIRTFCNKKNGAVVVGNNFSIGVNIWFKLIKVAAIALENISEYSVSIEETHHVNKKDKPSGTAITAAKIMLEQISRYDNWSFDNKEDKIHVISHRKADIAGKHRALFASFMDEIEIIHTARGRDGFAIGAIKAAEWIVNKKGYFEFNNIFEEVFKKTKSE